MENKISIWIDEPNPKMALTTLEYPTGQVITGHSWFNQTAHIAKDGIVRRGEIGEIVLNPSAICLRVRYRAKNVPKKRSFDPVFLMAMEFLWWSKEIVSEDEPEETSTITAKEHPLPPFRIHRSEQHKLSREQTTALTWLIDQCDNIQKLLVAS